MTKAIYLLLLFCLFTLILKAQGITIQVNANSGQKPVSPYLYGRNNSFSDTMRFAINLTLNI